MRMSVGDTIFSFHFLCIKSIPLARQIADRSTHLLRLLNHLPSVRSRTRGDGQTRQLSDSCTGEAVHGVSTDLQRELPTVQHGALEGVRLLLQVSLSTLTGSDEVLQDSREKTFAPRRRDEEI